MRSQWKVGACLLLIGHAWGCAGGPSSAARAGDPRLVAQALERSAAPAGFSLPGTPLVVLALDTPQGPRVTALDLQSGEPLWSEPGEVGARVTFGRGFLIHGTRAGDLISRRVDNGKILWQQPLAKGRTLLGLAADGDFAYVVERLKAGGPAGRGAVLRALAGTSGREAWSVELPAAAGAPAARGGIVAVPTQSQYVSLFDGSRGERLADILSREEAASFVVALPEGFVFGSKGLFLASGRSALGARDGGDYLTATLPDFIRAQWNPDGYRAELAAYSAVDRNRLLWRVEGGERARFLGNRVLVHHFRYLFGIDPGTGDLVWAYANPRADLVASSHVGTLVLVAAADGAIGGLDPSTGVRRFWRPGSGLDSGAIVRGATFDAEGFVPAGSTEPPSETALHETLTRIVRDSDRRFLDVKVFALSELNRLPGPDVTKDLLTILEDGEIEGTLPQKAVAALVARKDPSALDLYLASVRQHADFSEGRKAPRLDVLAAALTGLGATQAIPDLVEHLRLPDTDPSQVRDLAAAVVALRSKAAVEGFRDYLLQYRADPTHLAEPGGVMGAAEVLLKLGGPEDRALLLFVAQEAKTIAPLRASIDRALAQSSGGPEKTPLAP